MIAEAKRCEVFKRVLIIKAGVNVNSKQGVGDDIYVNDLH